MLLDQLPRNRVQLGEKERKLFCQAILQRLVLPQEHLTGKWLTRQHAVDDHILCLVLELGNRHLHTPSNKLENAAFESEPFLGVRVFGEASNELIIQHDDIIDQAILIEMHGSDDEGRQNRLNAIQIGGWNVHDYSLSHYYPNRAVPLSSDQDSVYRDQKQRSRKRRPVHSRGILIACCGLVSLHWGTPACMTLAHSGAKMAACSRTHDCWKMPQRVMRLGLDLVQVVEGVLQRHPPYTAEACLL